MTTARKLNAFLNEPASRLQALTQHANRLIEIQRIWDKSAPQPLARACRVATLDNKTLTLYADNGAVAAKVKQQLPSLLAQFVKRGIEITAIRVEVQAKLLSPHEKIVSHQSLSRIGLAHLAKLQQNLEESPLKTALARLIRHQGASINSKS